MDSSQAVTALAAMGILLPILGACLSLLILYLIIRHAVSAGLRDHQKWLEKNRPPASAPMGGGYIR
jgi:hypothetical protein